MINSDYLPTKPRLNPLTSDICSLDNFNRHRRIARVKDRRRISLITVHYMKTRRTLLLTYSTGKVGFEPERPEVGIDSLKLLRWPSWKAREYRLSPIGQGPPNATGTWTLLRANPLDSMSGCFL